MQSLKLLNIKILTESVLKTLSKNKILTISDFLDEDVLKLSVITKLDIPQVLNVKHEIFAKFSAPLLSGSTLLIKHNKFLNSGIESLDTLLNGGIPTQYITEICGLADSGKTQLCFQIAINCVSQTEKTVLYVDTKGDFSAVRIQKILDACGSSYKEVALIMYKIRVVHIWTIEELIDLFQNLKNKTLVIDNLCLIIIDSLPCLMFQYLGDDNKIGLSFLNTFVNYSRYLCKDLDIGLICVNIETRWVDTDIAEQEDDPASSKRESSYIETRNRCLGKYWQHIPALVIKLDKIQESNSNDINGLIKVNVKVLKSNYITNFNRPCNVYISDLGIT